MGLHDKAVALLRVSKSLSAYLWLSDRKVERWPSVVRTYVKLRRKRTYETRRRGDY